MRLIIFVISIIIFFAPELHAAGRVEESGAATINNEWVLVITAFDNSALPPAQRVAGEQITRNLVERLNTVNYRMRVSSEYAFYESLAWRQSVMTVARNLASRQNERSLLIFQGEPDWRYRRNLRRLDAQIETLREELALREADRPLVNTEPVFRISDQNLNGIFPAPPAAGTEFRFIQNQRADGFLTGEMREFHGRFFIRIKLFTLYTQSFVYEDEIIFSLINDTAEAVEEIASRLIAVLSGSRPAAVAVRAYPPDAQILINANLAGTGEVPQHERSPGRITIAVAADGFVPQFVETELVAGELTEVDVNLGPLLFTTVNIDLPGVYNAAVYRGALFEGFAPLSLQLPIDQLAFISVETPDGRVGEGVFSTPFLPDYTMDISLPLRMPPRHRVNTIRRQYYWSWGGVWITGIAAWVTTGMFNSQNAALHHSTSWDFARRVEIMNYVRIGSLIALGGAAAFNVVQMIRYLRVATDKSVPIIN